MAMATAPAAKKEKYEMEMFGDVREDYYYWLRDDSRCNLDVLSHLCTENSYVDFIMSETKEYEDKLYAEIRERLKEDDVSVPLQRGDYYYYKTTKEGDQYVQHCRRPVPDKTAQLSVHDTMPTGPDAPPQHVILDENILAKQHQYYNISAFKVSPESKLVAYAEDTKGNEINTIHIINAETREPVEKPLLGVTSCIEWAGDEALLYITMDQILRPDKVWLHNLGTEQSSDNCLYHEQDDKFSLDLEVSESKRFLFVSSESKTGRFVLYLDISKSMMDLKALTPRVEGVATSVSHRGDHLFIKRRTDVCFNSELLACPLDNVSAMKVLLPHRERSTCDVFRTC